jgi:hypothetical protein
MLARAGWEGTSSRVDIHAGYTVDSVRCLLSFHPDWGWELCLSPGTQYGGRTNEKAEPGGSWGKGSAWEFKARPEDLHGSQWSQHMPTIPWGRTRNPVKPGEKSSY